MIEIAAVEPLEAYLSNGAVKDVDVGKLLAGGVFSPIRERREVVEQVQVNPPSQTIEWSGGVDHSIPMCSRAASSRHLGLLISPRTVRQPTTAHG